MNSQTKIAKFLKIIGGAVLILGCLSFFYLFIEDSLHEEASPKVANFTDKKSGESEPR